MNRNVVVPIRQSKPQRGLHPEVVVYIFRSGDTVPTNTGDKSDIKCDLSPTGIRCSQQLGITLDAATIRFDYVVCSAATSAQRTAKETLHHHRKGVPWYNGVGRELYAPEDDADFALMWAARREAASQMKINIVPPEMLYSACRSMFDKTGFFDRFIIESARVMYSLPGIGDARRIAIFGHEIMNNAVGEALFPQHRRTLETTKLDAGDCIMLTARECRHFPLLPHQPD